MRIFFSNYQQYNVLYMEFKKRNKIITNCDELDRMNSENNIGE